MLPIVLIHGFPFDGTMWRAQAEFLRRHGYDVLTPDLAGFGLSTLAPTEGQTSIDSYAAEIHALIERQGGRAIVGGLSMGGYVLLALLRAHRECVAAAMLIDTRAEADTPEARANRLKSIDEVTHNGPAGLIDGLCGRLFRKTPEPGVVAEARAIMERQQTGAIIAAQWAMAHRRDQNDLLPAVTAPTLVMVGEEDAITPRAVHESMAARMGRPTLRVIAIAGHMAPMEQPQAVNHAIAEFLRAAAV